MSILLKHPPTPVQSEVGTTDKTSLCWTSKGALLLSEIFYSSDYVSIHYNQPRCNYNINQQTNATY